MTRCTRVGLLVAGMVLAGPRAWAQEQPPPAADSAADARQQYQEGTKAFKEKRYSDAALHFESAAAFKANATALYTAGLAWDLASRPERAADAYVRSLDTPGLDAKHANLARDRVAQLERSLGTAAVTAPEPGWKVQIDSFTEVSAPARLHGPAGSHVLTVKIPGRATTDKRDVVLEAGKTVPVEVKDDLKAVPVTKEPVTPAVPVEKPTPPQPEADAQGARVYGLPFWTGVKVFGVALVGVGVTALGGAVLLGLNANDAKSAYDAAPSQQGYDHASSLQTYTNVALVAGAVLVAAGVVLIAVPLGHEVRVKVAAAPNAAMLRGEF